MGHRRGCWGLNFWPCFWHGFVSKYFDIGRWYFDCSIKILALLCGFLIVVVNILVKPIRVRRTPEDELETTVKSGLFLRNRLIFDGGFDGGFVNFWDGFYSYTIFYLLKSGLFMQKNNLTTYALAKNQGFNSPRLHQMDITRTPTFSKAALP